MIISRVMIMGNELGAPVHILDTNRFRIELEGFRSSTNHDK